MKALIGHTGFVGSNISEQEKFDFFYNSKNIDEIKGMRFDLLVCAGVSGIKWKANKFPNEDYEQIMNLVKNLNEVKFNKLVLISSGSVYDNPVENAYGRNRLFLENYLMNKYDNLTIVRLPSLFGINLKKNSLYDLLNNEFDYLPNIKSTFQYYDLSDIWKDINIAINNNLKIVNFATEPMKFTKIVDLFSINYDIISDDRPIVCENIKTKNAIYWGKDSHYLYSKEEMFNQLKKFVEINKNES